MKKIFFITCYMFLFHPIFADTLTLVAYDPTYYKYIDDLSTTTGQPGLLTGISDIYYYYEPFTGNLTVSQTEWLSTGTGLNDGSGEIPADYDSVFHFTDITFNNMHDTLQWMTNIDIENLKNQFIEYQLAMNIPHAQIMNSIQSVLIQQGTNIINLAFNQLYSMGRNSGNGEHYSLGVWGHTLYNYYEHSGNNKFSSSTFGIVLGADNHITDSLIVGIGYNYNSTYVSNTDINNNIIFFYGKYQLTNLFINTMIGYNKGRYDYDTAKDYSHGYLAGLSLGYNTDFDITPSIAIRYMNNKISSPNKYINKRGTNLMTFVSGISYNYQKDKLSLTTHLNLTYDIIRPKQDIIINIPELNYAFIISENNTPIGLETGFNINLPIVFANMTIGYELGIRSRYTSHTGTIRLRYEF